MQAARDGFSIQKVDTLIHVMKGHPEPWRLIISGLILWLMGWGTIHFCDDFQLAPLGQKYEVLGEYVWLLAPIGVLFLVLFALSDSFSSFLTILYTATNPDQIGVYTVIFSILCITLCVFWFFITDVQPKRLLAAGIKIMFGAAVGASFERHAKDSQRIN